MSMSKDSCRGEPFKTEEKVNCQRNDYQSYDGNEQKVEERNGAGTLPWTAGRGGPPLRGHWSPKG